MYWTEAVNASKTGYAYRLVDKGRSVRIVNRMGIVARVQDSTLIPLEIQGSRSGDNFEPINGLIDEIKEIFPLEAQMKIFNSFDAPEPAPAPAPTRTKGIKALVGEAGEHIDEMHRITEEMFNHRDFTNPDFGNELGQLIQHATRLKAIL